MKRFSRCDCCVGIVKRLSGRGWCWRCEKEFRGMAVRLGRQIAQAAGWLVT